MAAPGRCGRTPRATTGGSSSRPRRRSRSWARRSPWRRSRTGPGSASRLYRRFRTREQLIRAVVEDVFATEIEPTAAATTGDPWADLTGTLARSLDAVAEHRVVLDMARGASALDVETVHRFGRELERLLDRARAAGVVRPELTVRDLAAVLVMAMATIPPDAVGRDDRRRYLALLTDGLRPGPAPLPPSVRPEPGVGAPPSDRPRH